MQKVTCTRPNASENISGVAFVRQADGSVVAEGVTPELAAQFAGIEGFVIEDEVIKETASKAKKANPEPVV
jgi:hypothetical protein